VATNAASPILLDFTKANDSEWRWHQLGHMQVCTSLQTDNHASNPPLSFLQAFLPPNQQHQSTVRDAARYARHIFIKFEIFT